MSKIARSSRGVLVDFELLAIKAQLASTPIPKRVEERKRAMDAKDGVKTDQLPDLEFLAMAKSAAHASSEAINEPEVELKSKQASQLKRK